ncbi:MmcB family DNA repair protein, partial [Clostridium perfringens]|uniref:MmcB family DNA repair protein n=2 Tax=Clostridium perfringens TaxID=1502 RepID=UPI0039E8CFD3
AEFNKNNATATKITQLFTSSKWLLGYETTRKAFKIAEQQDKYISLPEFRVYTGTSIKSRRIDVLALENVTVKTKLHQLHAHGIEIKVDKHDLLNDHKYTEYAEFVHFLWLAVPRELVELAEETAPPTVGIISVESDDTLVKVREAEKGNPLRLLDTFMVSTMKLM